jgi:hypothetical protein
MKPATAMFAPGLAFKVMQRLIRPVSPNGKPTDPIPALPR